jgi:hypothetical protein
MYFVQFLPAPVGALVRPYLQARVHPHTTLKNKKGIGIFGMPVAHI